jgi:uncharacterized protein YjbI with pentapeptide repeats
MARARGSQEMRYAGSIRPCPSCGAREHTELKIRWAETCWGVVGPCHRCQTYLSFVFETDGDPLDMPYHANELGVGPSAVITAAEFRAELARLLPLLPQNPHELGPGPWREGWDMLDRAIVTTNELAKLEPTRELAEQQKELHALRDRYRGEGARLNREEFPHGPPRGELTKASLTAHFDWIRNQSRGEGRLDLASLDLSGRVIGAQLLTASRFAGVKLVGAALRHATLNLCEWIDVDARRADFHSVEMSGTKLVRGNYAEADFRYADLAEARIKQADLSRACFVNGTWSSCEVVESTLAEAYFRNSVLTATTFRRCDLQRVSFAAPDHLPVPFARELLFEDCDLRASDWTGREMDGVTFVRCKLAGAHGRPRSTRITVHECDVDAEALLVQLR